MPSFIRLVNQEPFIMECYTENEYATIDESFPEFKISYGDDDSPRYTIHVRQEEENLYSELAKYDTLKECSLHILNLINSRN